jgi:hypothetical protein
VCERESEQKYNIYVAMMRDLLLLIVGGVVAVCTHTTKAATQQEKPNKKIS